MTHIVIGRRKASPTADRVAALLVDIVRRWRRGRIRAKLRRQLADLDDHLLRDVGLTRAGERDSPAEEKWPLP